MQNHNKSSLSTRVQIENSKYRNPDQMERSEADNNKENRQGIGTTMTISVRLMAWNTSVLVQTESNDVLNNGSIIHDLLNMEVKPQPGPNHSKCSKKEGLTVSGTNKNHVKY